MKKSKISKTEFKPKAFEIMRKVEEEHSPYIVTDRGKDVVEIRPVVGNKLESLKNLRGQILRYDNPLASVGEEWDADR